LREGGNEKQEEKKEGNEEKEKGKINLRLRK
jgi:hypothetical protein